MIGRSATWSQFHRSTYLSSTVFENASSSSTAAPQAAASAADSMASMLAQVQALRQQAVATQTTLRELQGQDAGTGADALMNAVDGTMAATALALALGLCATWWYLWRRPQRQQPLLPDTPVASTGANPRSAPPTPPSTAQRFATPPAAPARASEPVQTVATADAQAPIDTTRPTPTPSAHRPMQDWAPDSQLTPLDHAVELNPESHPSIFARMDSAVAFDPAAAADEVQRVRQSLARKREIRSQGPHLEHDDEPHAFLPQDLPQDLLQTTQALHVDPTADGDTARGELDFSFPDECDPSERNPAHDVPMPSPAPPPLPMTDLSLDTIAPNATPDLAITLALALESEALELWDEARELANEVLDGGDAEQIVQAQTLIHRLNAREAQIEYEAELLPPDPSLNPPKG